MLPGWPRADLVRRLCRALDNARRGLAPFGRSDPADDLGAAAIAGPDAALAEAAILLHVAAGVDAGTDAAVQQAVAARVAALDAVLLPPARSPRVACQLALTPASGPRLAIPHVLLGRRGHGDARFDRLFEASLASLAARGADAPSHRRLEALWLTALARGTVPGADFDAVAAISPLAHPLDLIWGERSDAIGFTRAVSSFTDFGANYDSGPRSLPRPAATLTAEAEALLARALLLEDFDLAGETLMIWPQLGCGFPPAAAFAFRVLADIEDRNDAGRTRGARFAGPSPAVMGMVCALALRPVIASALADDLAPPGLVTALAATIPAADTPWRSSLAALEPAERTGLATLLVDIAVLAAARAQDFAGVARLLGLAGRHGLADRPLCAQARQLLERMAIAVTG